MRFRNLGSVFAKHSAPGYDSGVIIQPDSQVRGQEVPEAVRVTRESRGYGAAAAAALAAGSAVGRMRAVNPMTTLAAMALAGSSARSALGDKLTFTDADLGTRIGGKTKRDLAKQFRASEEYRDPRFRANRYLSGPVGSMDVSVGDSDAPTNLSVTQVARGNQLPLIGGLATAGSVLGGAGALNHLLSKGTSKLRVGGLAQAVGALTAGTQVARHLKKDRYDVRDLGTGEKVRGDLRKQGISEYVQAKRQQGAAERSSFG